ncbi:MAG: hypothetical protein LBH24_02860, partial [Clostridiales bacterium]|nr:hypothetical protein [Clostridiales bacterium]
RQLLVLEGDNEFLQALRKAIKSYSALDDSLKQYLQKINRDAEKAEREAAVALAAAEAQRIVQAPPAKTPATKTPATKTPATKNTAAKTPATKTPATKNTTAKTPAAKKPAAKTPTAKKPATKTPGAKTEDDPV